MVAEAHRCAELARGDFEALAAAPPWATDAWGLGCTIRELFGGGARLESAEQLRDVAAVPKGLAAEYTKLLSQTAARRLNPAKARLLLRMSCLQTCAGVHVCCTTARHSARAEHLRVSGTS